MEGEDSSLLMTDSAEYQKSLAVPFFKTSPFILPFLILLSTGRSDRFTNLLTSARNLSRTPPPFV